MDIGKEQTAYLAALSKLRFSDEEATGISAELKEIIEYTNILSELDTEGIEPLSHVFNIVNVMREDEVSPSAFRDEILMNAPNRNDEAFIVPKTVE